LYIAGAGRSGSTLLERILGQLEGCVAVGELRHLWREDPAGQQCGCGKLLTQCDFWRAVMTQAAVRLDIDSFRAMQESQRRVDRIRNIPMMLSKSLASREYARNQAAYVDTLRRIYLAIHEMTGCNVIVDSSKDVSTLYLLSEMDDVRIRVLHLVRDSRAVAYSWTREKVRLHVVDQVTYMPRYSPQRSAADWMYRNALIEMARGRTDGYMRLRYEDLVADPLGVTERIARFIDLAGADLRFIEESELKFTHVSHTIAGNPMRFEKGAVRLRIDSAWQQELGQTDRSIVTTLTRPLLRRYDYI
jgi:hypothetical protein